MARAAKITGTATAKGAHGASPAKGATSATGAKSTKAAKGTKVAKGTTARRTGKAAWATLAVEVRNAVAMVVLSRPEVHNAFDETLIDELARALAALDADDSVRAVILLGAGRSFCAGADLEWMKRAAKYGHAGNVADATALASMLATLAGLSKPTIARVHGNVFGGGVGLVAACDIAVAAHDATFALSEAKLGLIPATISPYVIEAIGPRQARRFFLTAERFTAAEAFRIGLVHDIVPADTLDARVNEILGALLLAGPQAQAAAKDLIRAVARQPIDDRVVADTAERIARVRASAEGREGVAAFLARRAPAWVPAALRPE